MLHSHHEQAGVISASGHSLTCSTIWWILCLSLIKRRTTCTVAEWEEINFFRSFDLYFTLIRKSENCTIPWIWCEHRIKHKGAHSHCLSATGGVEEGEEWAGWSASREHLWSSILLPWKRERRSKKPSSPIVSRDPCYSVKKNKKHLSKLNQLNSGTVIRVADKLLIEINTERAYCINISPVS